jgi:hypothetical protein
LEAQNVSTVHDAVSGRRMSSFTIPSMEGFYDHQGHQNGNTRGDIELLYIGGMDIFWEEDKSMNL